MLLSKIYSLKRKGAVAMCGCNSGKTTQFTVRTADGETKTVKSEQEARTLVRMHGGSYTKTSK